MALRERQAVLPAPVRLLAGVWLASSTADQFLVFVLFWSAGSQGWSAAQTAIVVLVARLPTLVGGPLGGRLVDRVGAGPTLAADAAVRCAACITLAVDGSMGGLSLAVVLIATACAGLTAPAGYAATRYSVPRLVPDAELPRANAWLAVGDQLPLLLGAALVGPSIGLLGVGKAFIVPAVLLAAVVAVGPRAGSRERHLIPASRGHEVGTPPRRYAAGVWALIGLSVAYYAAYGPFETVFPVFSRQHLDAGANGFGLMWVMFGLGAIATVGLAPRLSVHRPGMWNAAGAIVWGLVTMPVLAMSSVVPAAGIFLLSGAVWGPYSAIETTALHRLAPASVHGRLFGTQRALLQTAAPAGAALGILATGVWSPTAVLLASTLGCSAAGCAALLVPGVRRRVDAAR